MIGMDDEIQVSFDVPLDDDGFVRRECPTCERQFKWFTHAEGEVGAVATDQYFCPFCGVPAGVDEWWTQQQLDHGRAQAAPAMEQVVQEQVADMFKGMKGVEFKPDPNFSLEIDIPAPLVEPNDMTIVEPPCHPTEPLKIPERAAPRVHCLICGAPFAA
jgi:ribosomal protein S27E